MLTGCSHETAEKLDWAWDSDDGNVLCSDCALNVGGGPKKRRNRDGTRGKGDKAKSAGMKGTSER